jgi:hypothetical protein
MHVNNVEKLLVLPVPSKDMKELTLERSPLHVSNVEKTLGHTVPSEHIHEFTLVQNLMHVKNVGKPSISLVTFENM